MMVRRVHYEIIRDGQLDRKKDNINEAVTLKDALMRCKIYDEVKIIRVKTYIIKTELPI